MKVSKQPSVTSKAASTDGFGDYRRMSTESTPVVAPNHISRMRVLLVLAVLTLACGLFWYTRVYNRASLHSDMEQYAAIAEAIAHPAEFESDYAYQFSNRMHAVPWTSRAMLSSAKAVTENYADAARFWPLPMAIVFVVGLWLLVFRLSRSIVLSTIIAGALTFVPLPVRSHLAQYEDIWTVLGRGAFLARNIFACVTPWLLLLTFWTVAKPSRWPLGLGINAAAVTYLHPVSAMAWYGAMFVVHAFATSPDRVPLLVRLKWLGVGVAATSVVVAPFALVWKYSTSTTFGASQEALQQRLQEMAAYFGPEYLDPLRLFMSFLDGWFRPEAAFFWLPLVAVLGCAIVCRREIEWSRPRTVLLFVLGVFLGGLLIPLLLHWGALAIGRVPLQIDAVRGIRVLVLAPYVGMAALVTSLAGSRRRVVIAAFAVAVCVGALPVASEIVGRPQNSTQMGSTTPASIAAMLESEPARPTTGVLNAIAHHSERNSQFIGPQWVRYQARRPLAFLWKDGNIFFYFAGECLQDWLRRRDVFIRAQEGGLRDSLRTIHNELGVSFVVYPTSAVAKENVDTSVLYQDEIWTLLDVRSP